MFLLLACTCTLTCINNNYILITGTIRCEGETGLEQQEFCHFNERFRDMCAPPARLLLENIAISPEGTVNNPDYDLCRCGFRQGNRDCVHSKLRGTRGEGGRRERGRERELK